MNANKRRVLAYELCREVTVEEMEKVSGGSGTATSTPLEICYDDDCGGDLGCDPIKTVVGPATG